MIIMRIIKAVCSILVVAALSSCAASAPATELKYTELFKIGYGYSDSQITRNSFENRNSDKSAHSADNISLEARNGLYHILSGNNGKIMRFSSYGDLLLVIQDARYIKNLMNADTEKTEISENEEDKSRLSPRINPEIGFQQLSLLAVDSAGTMYVSDRLPPSVKTFYDEKSQAFSDAIVRRFSKDGTELGFLGQEGVGGSPFPVMQGLRVTDDDKVAVISASSYSYHIFFFNADGSLLSSLKISRSTIPLPDSESSADSALASSLASIETLLPLPDTSPKPLVIAKVDYYQQNLDAVKNLQSWLFTIDASRGEIMQSIRIPANGKETEAPELIGVRGKRYYLMQKADAAGSGTASANNRFTLSILLENGVISKRYLVDLPKDVTEATNFAIGKDGLLYCLGFSLDYVSCLSWAIP